MLFLEILVENVFVCCVYDLLNIIHLILHIASHFYTLHFFF
jgi:hypothetical protein